jgi:hypothetical protein
MCICTVKKILQYTLRAALALFGIIVLLYAIAIAYVALNRKSIVEKVKTEISETLNGDVAIRDVDISFLSNFPRVAVVFKDVSIKDSLFKQHGHVFFSAGKLSAKVSIINVIRNKEPLNGFTIENSSMYLYTDTAGYTNSYLFTPRKKKEIDTTDKKGNVIKDFNLKHFRFVLDNRRREKLYDIDVASLYCDIKTTDTLLRFSIDKQSMIHSLAFNLEKGSFVKETSFEGDFDLYFSKPRQQLFFKDIEIDLKDQPFVLSGEFDFSGNRSYHLNVRTNNLDYTFGKTLMTRKIIKALSIVKVQKPVNVEADIKGIFEPGDPLVNVKWSSGPNNVQTPFFDVTNASFTGGYTNQLVPGQPRNDANSRIYVDNFTGVWEGLNVHSKHTTIDNLLLPYMKTDLQTKFRLETLNNLLESKTIVLQQGDGNVDITYHGPLQQNSNQNTFLNGRFDFSGGRLLYAPRGLAMENASGSILFKNTDVEVHDFRSTVKGNKLVMNGSARNILSMLANNPGKIAFAWQVYSPLLNLESFTALLQKRQAVIIAAPATGKLHKVAVQIDKLMNESNIDVRLRADKLLFKRFEASSVNAEVEMIKEDYNLKNVSFNHANGRMELNGRLVEKDANLYIAGINAKMDNVEINKVLYAFNNFGQDALMSDNIRGRLSSNVVVSMLIHRQLSSSPTELEGLVDFSLKNGELIDFQPLKKLQVFLFKNRDFENIKFAELKNRFEIKDREIKINRMEIQSTALSLFVQGVYSLKGNTDISIQVPLSNLKKRGDEYKPENIGADAKAGPSVFVRGTPGEDGNIKFKLDVFNKIRKHLRFKDKDKEKDDDGRR